MGEVIYTKFSINELVTYTREKKGVQTTSEHLVNSIITETRVTYKSNSLDSYAVSFNILRYSLLSLFYGNNRMKSSGYAKKSNEYIRQKQMGKKILKKGLVTLVTYTLEGISNLVEEPSLTTKK